MDNAKKTDSKTYSIDSKSSLINSERSVRASAAEKGHKLELDHMRSMSMTGVQAVPVFTDKNITVRLLDGETLLITGQNLSVKNLDVENGKLSVSGQVSSLRYTNQATPTSFIKRIFK